MQYEGNAVAGRTDAVLSEYAERHVAVAVEKDRLAFRGVLHASSRNSV